MMKTSDFDYDLPPELIAQTPIEPRDRSRLMVLDREAGSIKHHRFFELIDFLRAGDVLVFNNSRVIPARLTARKIDTGGKFEILLLRRVRPNVWETLVKPARRAKTGTRIEIKKNSAGGDAQGRGVVAEVITVGDGGMRLIEFPDEELLSSLGEVPLPPYIHQPLTDTERYQTVYADINGSVAAPTAGLHFTPELIDKLREKGIINLLVTLHIGLDTFRPVAEENPLNHQIHREYGVIPVDVARELSSARKEGRRIICVGTSSVRLVEAAAQNGDPLNLGGYQDWVDLFIVPGYEFRMVDAMITNFHLPRSTLLMLVSAFAGGEFISRAYQEAIAEKYRFYSFGDCLLIN